MTSQLAPVLIGPAVVDCSSFDAELGLNGEYPAAQWTITLEAFDTSGGPAGTDKAVIEATRHRLRRREGPIGSRPGPPC